MIDFSQLEQKAKEIRRKTFEMVISAGKGHLGGALSMVEMLVALYYGGVLRFDPKNPKLSDRDIFILSKGHSSNSLHVVLANLGFFSEKEIANFSKKGSILGQHCDPAVPGVEFVSGSLGHGLGVASGIAFGNKLDGKDGLTFVILGDGESQEGSVWEAAMFASQHKLNNLVAIVDRNGLGSEDYIKNTCELEPLADKWRAFGWEVKEINGHSFPEIFAALDGCRNPQRTQPLVIISKTIKGKGLSCLENVPRAHHTIPKGEEIEISRKELS